MAEREVALTTVNGGINRLRTKGAALQDSLYDALNCYVTASKTVKVRPGTFRTATLPTHTDGTDMTKGLCAFDGELHVFAAEDVSVPAGYVLHILSHPDPADSAGNPIPLTEIHFAAPFMGFLYVVAEFEGGDIFHFWLQTGDTWTADTIYKLGDIVAPTVPNGFAFQATRATPAHLSWAPNVQRHIPDSANDTHGIIEPTEYNDFFYTVVDTQGDNPRSGTSEPAWPTEDGAQITEDADGTIAAAPVIATPQPDPNTKPAPSTTDRYSGLFKGTGP
jgi:hypothetical protein